MSLLEQRVKLKLDETIPVAYTNSNQSVKPWKYYYSALTLYLKKKLSILGLFVFWNFLSLTLLCTWIFYLHKEQGYSIVLISRSRRILLLVGGWIIPIFFHQMQSVKVLLSILQQCYCNPPVVRFCDRYETQQRGILPNELVVTNVSASFFFLHSF